MTIFSVLTVLCVSPVCVRCPYTCTEEDRPAITVQGNFYPDDITVLYPGGPMEIFCTGKTNQLILTRSTDSHHPLQGNWVRVKTEPVNDTTVRFYSVKAEIQASFYMCSDIEAICRKAMFLIVDVPPDFRDFRCISHNLDDLNCTWTSRNAVARFTLFDRREDYKIPVCRFYELDFVPNMNCAWRTYSDDTMKSSKHLILEACNRFGCSNQTYKFPFLPVIKLDPPRNLKTLQIGSHNVLLQWEKALSRHIMHRIELDHKVEFWYAGVNFTSANTSSLIEDYETYQLELKLQCPNENYEVRVSMKPSEAIGDEYWSRYTSTYFKTTKERTESGKVDPTCGKKLLRETKEVMSFKIGELKDYLYSENSKVITEIEELKARAAKVNQR